MSNALGERVQWESGIEIEGVKIKIYGLTMDLKIIENLKQALFLKKKKREQKSYIGVFGHMPAIANYSFWD